MVVGVDDALLIAAAASVASAGIGYAGAQSANSANANINRSTMEYNWAAQQSAANRNIDMMRESSDRSRYDSAVNWDRTQSALTQSEVYNAAEAQKARDWSQYMSNSAYQRATIDTALCGD